MNSADMCRERGWTVGDVLLSPSGAVAEITAIGREGVLVAYLGVLGPDGFAPDARQVEVRYSAAHDWTLATPEQLATIKGPPPVTFGDLEVGDWFRFEGDEPILRDDEGGYMFASGLYIDRNNAVAPSIHVTRMSPLEVAQWLVRDLQVSIVEHEEPGSWADINGKGSFRLFAPDALNEHDLRHIVAQGAALLAEHPDRTDHEPVELQAGGRISVIAEGEIGNIRARVAVREHTQPAPGYRVDDRVPPVALMRGEYLCGYFDTRAEAVARSWELCDDEERSQ